MSEKIEADPFLDLMTYFTPTALPSLLAHYTSVSVLENMLREDEVWFSNPLFMNDWQELRFGLNEGSKLFLDEALLLKAGATRGRAEILRNAFNHYFRSYDENEAFDTYLFCLTAHREDNNDGLLSMWRGYGHHGSGVAIVFNTTAITEVPQSPLIVAKVDYASDKERLQRLSEILDGWATMAESAKFEDDQLYKAAHYALWAIKTFALTTKHKGFDEEDEWRVIYYPDRDSEGLLAPFKSYHIGRRGVEPKLKYKIGHIAGVSAPDLALARIIHSIILGPSMSSPLAVKSVGRMLEAIKRPQYKDRLRASGIPLRADRGDSF